MKCDSKCNEYKFSIITNADDNSISKGKCAIQFSDDGSYLRVNDRDVRKTSAPDGKRAYFHARDAGKGKVGIENFLDGKYLKLEYDKKIKAAETLAARNVSLLLKNSATLQVY